MTRDEIVLMARKADLWLTSDERIAAVVRFAARVAAAEREACAQLCENFEFEFADDSAGTLIDVAKAIRARAEK